MGSRHFIVPIMNTNGRFSDPIQRKIRNTDGNHSPCAVARYTRYITSGTAMRQKWEIVINWGLEGVFDPQLQLIFIDWDCWCWQRD